MKSIPAAMSVDFSVDFDSVVDKKLNYFSQIFIHVICAKNMEGVPSALVSAVDINSSPN
jgi:hypothetical protein